MVFDLEREKQQIQTNLLTFLLFAFIKGKIYSLLMPISSVLIFANSKKLKWFYENSHDGITIYYET